MQELGGCTESAIHTVEVLQVLLYGGSDGGVAELNVCCIFDGLPCGEGRNELCTLCRELAAFLAISMRDAQ